MKAGAEPLSSLSAWHRLPETTSSSHPEPSRPRVARCRQVDSNEEAACRPPAWMVALETSLSGPLAGPRARLARDNKSLAASNKTKGRRATRSSSTIVSDRLCTRNLIMKNFIALAIFALGLFVVAAIT